MSGAATSSASGWPAIAAVALAVNSGCRPVVVNFWASWCPPCVAEMPDLETVHREFADEVDFLGINAEDSPDAAADLAERMGVSYDLARDPNAQLFQWAWPGHGHPHRGVYTVRASQGGPGASGERRAPAPVRTSES